MSMFHVTKLVSTINLDDFLQSINSFGEVFVERETRVDADRWLLCIGCADRDLMQLVRGWTPSIIEPDTSAPCIYLKS